MTTIFWAGDSTVKQNTILTYPQTGIGQMFPLFLHSEVRVENHAENGRSTKSFLDEGRLAPIYDRLENGDFLFIQFGHNDEKRLDPDRYTLPEDEFSENLEKFVNVARNKSAYPVIITPVTRRGFQDPNAAYSHDGYREAAIATATRLGVPCIDLTTLSEQHLLHVGPEKSLDYYMHIPAGVSLRYPEGINDDTHLRPEGAIAFGRLVAQELYRLGNPYAAVLCEGFEQVPTL